MATPRKAFQSFKRAFEAENPSLEWKCLSDELKERENLTEFTYTVGRERFIRKNAQAIENFKKARIKEILYSPDRRRALLIMEAPGTKAYMDLINQPYFELIVNRGEEEIVWGFMERLEDHLSVQEEMGKDWILIRIPLEGAFGDSLPGLDEKKIVRFTLSDEWKLLNLEVHSDALTRID